MTFRPFGSPVEIGTLHTPVPHLMLSRVFSIAAVIYGTAITTAAAVEPSSTPLILSLSGLVSIGMGFYWSGKLNEKVTTHDTRLEALEGRSPSDGQLERLTAQVERVASATDRLDAVLNGLHGQGGLIGELLELRSDLRTALQRHGIHPPLSPS